MIIGDLDLDWAENDTDYLARITGFLISEFSNPSIDSIGIENVDSIQYMVQYNGSLNTESTLVDNNNIFLLSFFLVQLTFNKS